MSPIRSLQLQFIILALLSLFGCRAQPLFIRDLLPELGFANIFKSDTLHNPQSESSLPLEQFTNHSHSSEIVGLFPVEQSTEWSSQNKIDLISVEQNGGVLGWNISSGMSRKLLDLKSNINTAALHIKSSSLALAQNGGVTIINLKNGERYFENRFRSRLQSLRFSPDGLSVIAASGDGSVFRWRWWDKEAAGLLREFERYTGHASIVSDVQYHPYGRVIFSADWDGVISAWLSYDSDYYSGNYDKNTFAGLFFSEQTRRMKSRVQGVFPIEHIRITPDGLWMLVVLQNGKVELWSTRGLQKSYQSIANDGLIHNGLIYDIAIDTSGEYFATAARDDKVIISKLNTSDPDKANFEQLKAYQVHDVSKLAFASSSDKQKKILFAGLRDGRVLVLQL